MELSAQIVVISLFLGLILAFIYKVYDFLIKKFKLKKYIVFIIDINFVCIACIMSFLLSLAISSGFPRLMQYLLEAIAFFCVIYVLSGIKKKKI